MAEASVLLRQAIGADHARAAIALLAIDLGLTGARNAIGTDPAIALGAIGARGTALLLVDALLRLLDALLAFDLAIRLPRRAIGMLLLLLRLIGAAVGAHHPHLPRRFLLLRLLWLRLRLRHELQPLQRLAQHLSTWDAPPGGMPLGPPERSELGPVHLALTKLSARLEQRLARERAFTAHAAHALRTPLAGIDAQLAVALREAAPEQQPRLQRTRAAAGRLQRVVAALLALFRSSNEPQRQPLHLADLLARTPLVGLQLHVSQAHSLHADADLVHAALLNLLDNSLRHGAQQAWVDTPSAQVLRVTDDGPGVDALRRAQLLQALDAGGEDASPGLGLLLADLVARSHGGRLYLPASAAGFVAELHLQASADTANPAPNPATKSVPTHLPP